MIDIVHTREKVEIYMYIVVNTYGAYTSIVSSIRQELLNNLSLFFFIFQAGNTKLNASFGSVSFKKK